VPRLRPDDAAREASSVVHIAIEGALLGAVLGALAGWLWETIAPTVLVTMRDVGDGELGAVLAPHEAMGRFDVQAWFAVVTAGLALVLTVAMMIRHRTRPLSVLAAGVLGSAIGSLVCWRVGAFLGPNPPEQAFGDASAGDQLPTPLEIDAYVVLLVAPIVAGAVVLFAAVAVLGPEPWHVPGRRPSRPVDEAMQGRPADPHADPFA